MNLDLVNQVINIDKGLSESEKKHLQDETVQKDIEKFLAGGTGAALGVVVAKYLKLSRTVQMILGALGYGAGKAVYNMFKDTKPTGRYNEKTRTYEIDTQRY